MRATIVLLLTLTAIAAFGLASQASAQRPQTTTVPCAIQFVNGKHTCYGPAGVVQAEKQARFAVRPSAAVYQTMHLRLSQVIVDRACPSCGVSGIRYLYGALRGDYGRAPARPKSVEVMEYPGRVARFQTQYAQQACGTRMEISPAALDHPYRPYGPWFLIANFQHRNLSLGIVANTDQGMIKRLACAIVRAG